MLLRDRLGAEIAKIKMHPQVMVLHSNIMIQYTLACP